MFLAKWSGPAFVAGGSDRRWWLGAIFLVVGAVALGIFAARLLEWPPPIAVAILGFPALLLAQARALPLVQVRAGSPATILKQEIGPFWTSIPLDATTSLHGTSAELTIAIPGQAPRVVISTSIFMGLDLAKTHEALAALARNGRRSDGDLAKAGFTFCDTERSLLRYNAARSRSFRLMLAVALVSILVATAVATRPT